MYSCDDSCKITHFRINVATIWRNITHCMNVRYVVGYEPAGSLLFCVYSVIIWCGYVKCVYYVKETAYEWFFYVLFVGDGVKRWTQTTFRLEKNKKIRETNNTNAYNNNWLNFKLNFKEVLHNLDLIITWWSYFCDPTSHGLRNTAVWDESSS
jgi:hypothetical protein